VCAFSDAEVATSAMLYSYKHMFNGFAASMTAAEAVLLAGLY
jgi:hypothetical protein